MAIDHGDLAESMSASMAVPLALSPVVIEGTMYVDGGVTNNLPVDVAKRMGADVIIAVDVGTPLAEPDTLKSLLDVTGQLTRMMTRKNADLRRQMLGPSDVLIEPQLGDISSSDFGKTLETVGLGREATELHARALSRLALSEEAFAAHVAPQRRTPIDVVSTDKIDIAYGAATEVEEKFLLRTMRIPAGEEIPVEKLERGIGRVYGLSLFDEVSYDALEDGVHVKPRRKPWGPNFLRTGINMAGDFSGRTTFSLGASVTVTELNLTGAEWRSELEVGTNARLFTELYQPLRVLGHAFFVPSVQMQGYNFPLYDDEDLVAEYRVNRFEATLALGTTLSNWGEMRAGITKGKASTDRIVGDPSFPNVDDDLGRVFYRFSTDTLDNRYFPGSGVRTSFEWTKSHESIGGEQDYASIEFDSAIA
ncbi:MAG: patatin-like phospholipase family protein, partial [Gammaproteobacteria bacterium]